MGVWCEELDDSTKFYRFAAVSNRICAVLTLVSRGQNMAPTKNALRHLGPRDPRVPPREERHQWIKEVAYYKALNRRFIPGHELLDWLAAEQEVDALCRQFSEN